MVLPFRIFGYSQRDCPFALTMQKARAFVPPSPTTNPQRVQLAQVSDQFYVLDFGIARQEMETRLRYLSNSLRRP